MMFSITTMLNGFWVIRLCSIAILKIPINSEYYAVFAFTCQYLMIKIIRVKFPLKNSTKVDNLDTAKNKYKIIINKQE